jgi:hypothetical protein
MSRRFGHSLRPPCEKVYKYNVGPGQYRHPSEFGYYENRSFWDRKHGIKRKRKKKKVYTSMTLHNANIKDDDV